MYSRGSPKFHALPFLVISPRHPNFSSFFLLFILSYPSLRFFLSSIIFFFFPLDLLVLLSDKCFFLSDKSILSLPRCSICAPRDTPEYEQFFTVSFCYGIYGQKGKDGNRGRFSPPPTPHYALAVGGVRREETLIYAVCEFYNPSSLQPWAFN